MRFLPFIIGCITLAGCNLFTSTPDAVDGGTVDDMTADMSPADVEAPDLDPAADADVAPDLPNSLVGWETVSAGGDHTCALTAAGEAFCWGAGDDGQLGNGGMESALTPTAVIDAPVFEVLHAGGAHTCGLDLDGALWCWGYAGHFGAAENQTTPFQVSAGPFSRLSVGDDGVCVIDESSHAKCVGENDWGQLGLATDDDALILTDLGGAPLVAADIAVGNEFTCALAPEGLVTCFGRELQYGVDHEDADDFLTQTITTPVQLVSIEAGEAHACGQSADGTTYCWGAATFIEALTTGGGPTTAGEVPTVVDLTTYVSGSNVLCGLDAAGLAYCLGSNYRGIQGKGTDNRDPRAAEPIERISSSEAFLTISVGPSHGCGITVADDVLCWGQAFDGRLGNGEIGWRTEPVEVNGPTNFTAAAVAGYSSCGLDDAGILFCWGRGAYGALGNGGSEHVYEPVAVDGLTLAVSDAWGSHVCGLQADGTGYCWGTDDSGVLGNGSSGGGDSPGAILAPERLLSLSISADHACAVGITEVFCWGDSLDVGANVGSDRNTPTALSQDPHPVFVQLSAGVDHSCGIDMAGDAWCFGLNDVGQLGDGTTTTSRFTSVAVAGGHTFRVVRAGDDVSCGITETDELYCWGVGARVPDGSSSDRNTPVADSEGLSWADVNMGERSVCGVTTTGDVYCWGLGSLGRLGDGDTTTRQSPVPVELPEPATHVAAGGEHGCAVGVSGKMYCWGSQEFGRLGDGFDSIYREPTPIVQ